MATTTSNLGLVKPELQDNFNLKLHLNDNWDKIDTAFEVDPNRHAEYFDITENGELSLKPEYRGATSNATYTNSISDMGAGVVGSLNSELPANLIIPEVVNEIAVDRFSSGMFLDNTVIESLTFPITVDEIPSWFANQAVNLRQIKNTEHIRVIGEKAFRSCRIERLVLPNLERFSGTTAFGNNSSLKFADIGKVTEIPLGTFAMSVELSKVYSDGIVTSIGQQGFYNTPRLANVNFISNNLTSIGKAGLWRTGISYDWSSLTNCTFGVCATTLQANPTDFWSALTPTPCENPIPTKLCQRDPRWVNREIGTSGKTYKDGCTLMCAMHMYSGLTGVEFSSVTEFEDIVNRNSPNFLNNFNMDISHIRGLMNDLGFNATYNSQTVGWNANILNTLYEVLANGGYATVVVGTPVSHAIVVYGVNDKKELLYLDSERYYYYDTTKYTMGKLPFEKLIATKAGVVIVTP